MLVLLVVVVVVLWMTVVAVLSLLAVVVSAGGKVEQEDVCKFCTQSLKMILIVLTQTPAPIVFYNAERSVMLEG